MKKKEIITLVVALLVIGVSVFFIFKMLFPTTQVKTEGAKIEVQPVPLEIDEKTYDSVNDLRDYGKPAVEGVGKSDLFSGI